MTVELSPYLSFTDQTREAMGFYHSVLGGELSIMTFGDMGMEGEAASRVMHAMLRVHDGLALMSSDRTPDMPPVRGGDQVVVALHGDDVETMRGWFAGLSEGASVDTPLAPQVWGDEYGDLTDRYGIRWVVNIATGGSAPAQG